jgi:Phage integrase family
MAVESGVGSEDAGTSSRVAAHGLGLRDVERGCSGASESNFARYGEGLLEAYSATSQFECRAVPSLMTQLREPFNTMALLCLCLGLRVSELLALGWRDVDWLSGKLNVARGIVNQIVDDVKTDGSRKMMTIDRELLATLNLWRETTQFNGEHDWIFASPLSSAVYPTATRDFGASCNGPLRLQELGR